MAKSNAADSILTRLERQAVALGDTSAFEPPKYAGVDEDGRLVPLPRWRIDSKWIEFECGCRAERFAKLFAPSRKSDPIIFEGLPEQALYDFVCHRHSPAMNVRVKFQGYVDFNQWRRARRNLLLGITI